MADRSILYSDLWTIYKSSDQYKEQIIHWFNLEKHLPLYTSEMQVQVLEGAPIEILKKHRKLILPKARKKLGLEEDKPVKKKTWSYSW